MGNEHSPASSSVISQTIEPRATSLGALEIRRYLPSLKRKMVGPFIFMDQAGPVEVPTTGGGVPEHPHAGLSTFTYLMSGSVRHADSAGNVATIRQGDVALMSAGSGITHEEMPPKTDDPSPTRTLEFAQMWLALPDEVEESDPSFQHATSDEVPKIDLPGGHITLTIGSGWGTTAPIHTPTETVFADVTVNPDGAVKIEAGWDERALLLLDGDATIDGHGIRIHDLPILEACKTATLRSNGGARLLLFGGERFGTDRYIAGNFVASSPEKIRHWMSEYQLGRFPSINPA